MTVQNEYSLLERGIEADLVPLCERLGIGVIPYGRNWSTSAAMILEAA